MDNALGGFEVSHTLVIRHRVSACSFDFFHDLLSRSGVCACPVKMPAEVIDHDLSAVFRQEQRFLAPNASSSAGDNCDLAVQ